MSMPVGKPAEMWQYAVDLSETFMRIDSVERGYYFELGMN